MKVTVKLTVEFEVEGVYTPGVPDYIAPLPEDSYPGEGATFEFDSVKLSGIELPDDVYSALEDELIDAAIAEVERNHLDALDPAIII